MSKLKELLALWAIITFVPGLFIAACVSFIEMDISLMNPYYWNQGARVSFCGYAAAIAVVCGWLNVYSRIWGEL